MGYFLGPWGFGDGVEASEEVAGADPWVAASPRAITKAESQWAAMNSSYSRITSSLLWIVCMRRINRWRSPNRNLADNGLGV